MISSPAPATDGAIAVSGAVDCDRAFTRVETTDADVRAIRRTPLFARLDDAVFERLMERHEVGTAPKDACILRFGERAECLVFLLDGLVKLVRTGPEGASAILQVQGAGRALMLAETLAGGTCPADARTVTPVRLMRFPARTLREELTRDSGVAMAVLAAASLDLRQLIAQVEELKAMTAPGRIAAMILDLAPASEGPAKVKLPYAKQLVAGRLGMTPESFSRAVRRLAPYGVSPRGDEMKVADLARLREFIETGGRDDA